MSQQKPTGPAQPDQIDHQEGERSPARLKDQARDRTVKKQDDQPGAEGPLSADANEDTYD